MDCSLELDECKKNLNIYIDKWYSRSKMNTLSLIYTLPYISYTKLKVNDIKGIDRFKFDLSKKISRGSFGNVYAGEVEDKNKDPLNEMYKDGKPSYVIKISSPDQEDKRIDVEDTLIEMNIQSILYNMMNVNLKLPYIYPKLFVDRENGIVGFISEKVPNTDLYRVLSGIHSSGLFINDGVKYSIFKVNVLNKLNDMYNDMSKNEGDFVFKHNDLHIGNVTLEVLNNGSVGYKIIDYGLATISRVYSMDIDSDTIDYLNLRKIDTFLEVCRVLPTEKNRIEFSTYMKFKPMSDYHFFIFSLCSKVYTSAIYLSTLDDPITAKRSETNIQKNEWLTFINDVKTKYLFLSNLSTKGYDILYDGVVIEMNKEYQILYEHMNRVIKDISSMKFGKKVPMDISRRAFIVRLITKWNISHWRIVSLFIEFYMSKFEEYTQSTSKFVTESWI